MKAICHFSLFALSCLLASALTAQEEAAAEAEAEAVKPAAVEEKPFHILPLCRLMEGGAEVMYPGKTAWVPLEEGRFYPLGCSYRTVEARSKLRIQFGAQCEVSLDGVASFGTSVQPLNQKDRTLILKGGTINLSLPRNLKPGLFKVTAPGFTVRDLSGDSSYTFVCKSGDGDLATVRCVTGSMAIEGRHFSIASMRAADEVQIRTSLDMLFTGLYGTSGDYVVKLDQGVATAKEVETGAEKSEERKLDWHLSPRTAVRIHRAVPRVGSRLSVTVMTFDESGELVNRCAFAEGLSELNTGEQGEKALAEKEANAKRAMQDAEAVTTEAASEETTSAEEEKKENTKEESTEE